jgi:hypothetical protein
MDTNKLTPNRIEQMRKTCKSIIGIHRTKPDNLTYAKIGNRFGVSPSTVKNSLHYRDTEKSLQLLVDIYEYLVGEYS